METHGDLSIDPRRSTGRRRPALARVQSLVGRQVPDAAGPVSAQPAAALRRFAALGLRRHDPVLRQRDVVARRHSRGDTYPDHIAATYAYYDNQPGRAGDRSATRRRPAPILYDAPRGYGAERRGEDFYGEGELMWLKVDSDHPRADRRQGVARHVRPRVLRRREKHRSDRRDVRPRRTSSPASTTSCPTTGPDSFARGSTISPPHPPDGFTADGWKLEYTDVPSHWVRKNDFWYSLGFSERDGTVGDVREGSPAWNASLGIDTKLVAVNGRAYSSDVLFDALEEAAKTRVPIGLLVRHGDAYRTIAIAYFGGPRYPHLVRIAGVRDRLMEVVKPRS